MRKVARSEIIDYQTYEETRQEFRLAVMREKDRRRVHVGDFLTFLFENPLTIRYQIQEMIRSERIVKERDIAHEIGTYNELLGGDGEIGCSLLIEIDDPDVRDEKLRAWRDLPAHLYARLENGAIIRPVFDEGQRSQERLSSVQYLRFAVGGKVPMAIGVDLPGAEARAVLTEDQRAALAEDLAQS